MDEATRDKRAWNVLIRFAPNSTAAWMTPDEPDFLAVFAYYREHVDPDFAWDAALLSQSHYHNDNTRYIVGCEALLKLVREYIEAITYGAFWGFGATWLGVGKPGPSLIGLAVFLVFVLCPESVRVLVEGRMYTPSGDDKP